MITKTLKRNYYSYIIIMSKMKIKLQKKMLTKEKHLLNKELIKNLV